MATHVIRKLISAIGKSISCLERQNTPKPELGHALHKTGEIFISAFALKQQLNT